MRIKFENLPYQEEAIESTIELFEGQPIESGVFTIETRNQNQSFIVEKGVSNRLVLSNETIKVNLNRVQLKNGLKQSSYLKDLDFCIDMETGTGKTYVYLRTIMDLNKKYGFTKFIIVVPSIAIKEGVLKSLEMTEEDFSSLYQNQPYSFFEYDSRSFGNISEFATSNQIQIMVINIQAFNKGFTTSGLSKNLIHQPQESLNGNRPIDLIGETNPIVIVDEPQSVMSGASSKAAMKSLKALATFRYSATHKDKINYIYKLDAVDAFNLKLVKQIEVYSAVQKDANNEAYIELLSVDNKKSPITAKVKIDVADKNGVKRKAINVRSNDDLYQLSGRRDIYSSYVINDIYAKPGEEYISFTGNSRIIKLGQSIGGLDDDIIKRGQIKATIEEHLNKELSLNKKDIKVLSLFFIDRVKNYRIYNEDGSISNGKYGEWFEEECFNLIRQPKYRSLLPEWVKATAYSDSAIKDYVKKIHNGYFSADKNGIKDTSGNTQDDEKTYELIMKDKESLLSFDTDLRFIFSHSALKEGWDNPNVFQICTLNETMSTDKKRQEIGRGLRIAVNQNGERVYGFDVNTLTVMANESYDEFAQNLQKEYEDDAGYRFGYIEEHTFANLQVKKEDGIFDYIGEEESKKIFDHLVARKYVAEDGKVQLKVKTEIEDDSFYIDIAYREIVNDVTEILIDTLVERVPVKPIDKKRPVKVRKEVLLSEDFNKLWDKIKFKTKYSVEIDSDKLINACVLSLDNHIKISRTSINWERAKFNVEDAGIVVDENTIGEKLEPVVLEYKKLPDILSALSNSTSLTRKTIAKILDKSNSLRYFKVNPQQYMDQATDIINEQKEEMLVDGIKYTRIGNDEYSIQELYLDKELFGYLDSNIVEARKNTHDYVIYDSQIERSFAKNFEANKAVKLYSKLPPDFKIDTPLGTYNPDWAVVMEDGKEEKIYLIVESKGTTKENKLRGSETDKIDCGKKHFKAVGTGIELVVKDDANELIRDNIAGYDVGN